MAMQSVKNKTFGACFTQVSKTLSVLKNAANSLLN